MDDEFPTFRPELLEQWKTMSDLVEGINAGDVKAMNAMIEEWKANCYSKHSPNTAGDIP